MASDVSEERAEHGDIADILFYIDSCVIEAANGQRRIIEEREKLIDATQLKEPND